METDYKRSLLFYLEKQNPLTYSDIKPWIIKSKIPHDTDLYMLLGEISYLDNTKLIKYYDDSWANYFKRVNDPPNRVTSFDNAKFLFKLTEKGQKAIDEIHLREKTLYDKILVKWTLRVFWITGLLGAFGGIHSAMQVYNEYKKMQSPEKDMTRTEQHISSQEQPTSTLFQNTSDSLRNAKNDTTHKKNH